MLSTEREILYELFNPDTVTVEERRYMTFSEQRKRNRLLSAGGDARRWISELWEDATC